jgi:hypothetical protein
MNLLSSEAGDTPAPAHSADLVAVEQAAKVLWRAFPYFAFRYGARGRAFGRSDAGYVVTLAELSDDMMHHQLRWLGELLAVRGMPSILLEHQLDLLGRSGRRSARGWSNRMLAAAAEMRRSRTAVLPEAVSAACERACRAAARDVPMARGAGRLIAAAVADRALGFGAHDEALLRVMCEAAAANEAWRRACIQAHCLALGALEVSSRRVL